MSISLASLNRPTALKPPRFVFHTVWPVRAPRAQVARSPRSVAKTRSPTTVAAPEIFEPRLRLQRVRPDRASSA